MLALFALLATAITTTAAEPHTPFLNAECKVSVQLDPSTGQLTGTCENLSCETDCMLNIV